jgi:hypothetical protein
MAGFNADSRGEIALSHPRSVTSLFNDRAERSFGHPLPLSEPVLKLKVILVRKTLPQRANP